MFHDTEMIDTENTVSIKETGMKTFYNDYKKWCEDNCIRTGQMEASQFGQNIRKLKKILKIEDIPPINRKGPHGQKIKITKV